MSLLRIRRERKSQWGPSRPPRLWKLVLGFAVVIYLIWFLGQRA